MSSRSMLTGAREVDQIDIDSLPSGIQVANRLDVVDAVLQELQPLGGVRESIQRISERSTPSSL